MRFPASVCGRKPTLSVADEPSSDDVFLPSDATKATNRRCCLKTDNLQLVLIVCGVLVGLALGFGLRAAKTTGYTDREVSYISFLGDIFLRMLKMLILPLIISSLIGALTKLELRSIGKMAYVTIIYFLISTLAAVIEGIVLVVSIRPGSQNNSLTTDSGNSSDCRTSTLDSILNLFINMFPDNMLEATFSSTKTCISVATGTVSRTSESGMNILGLVTISIAFAVVINLLGSEGKPLKDLFNCIEAATMKLVSAVIWFCPIGIVFLIAGQIVKMKDIVAEFTGLGLFVATVIAALVLHGAVVLPLIYVVVVRKNPLTYFRGCIQPFVTAAGTSSSSATLPVTVECMEQKCGIDKRIAQFVCPLGATINMNGTALYEAVAALYIAQVIGRSLSIGEIIMVSLSATVTAVGAAGIPSAGPVTTLIVLTAVGLPVEYAALVAPVDWFMDRLRTAVNVFSDCVGAAVVQKLCAGNLPAEEMKTVVAKRVSVPGRPVSVRTSGHAIQFRRPSSTIRVSPMEENAPCNRP